MFSWRSGVGNPVVALSKIVIIKAAERHLHVKTELLVNIISLLDDLYNKEDIEW